MPHRTTRYADSQVLRDVGAAVRRLRKAAGLSQESLANDAEIDRSYFGAIERAEVNLTLMTFVRVCDELGALPSEVLQQAGM